MRPPHRYRLKVEFEPQSESRHEEFQQALREFIEVLARAKIEKLRSKSPEPPKHHSASEDAAQLPHLVPPSVGAGIQSK